MNGSVYLPLECIENMLILGVCSCACAVPLILLTLDTVLLAYQGCCNLKESISAWTCVIRGEYYLVGVCAGVQDTALLSILYSSDGKPQPHSSMEPFRFYVKRKKKNIYICIYINLFGMQVRLYTAVKKSQQWHKCWIYTLLVFLTHLFVTHSYTHKKIR